MDQPVVSPVSATLLALRASDGELAFIAALVPNDDQQRHLHALRRVVYEQDGLLDDSQLWYPFEAVESGARALEPGHEREFALCTLILLNAAASGIDIGVELGDQWADHVGDYERLPTSLREGILDAYQSMGIRF